MRKELTLGPAVEAVTLADTKINIYSKNDARDDEIIPFISLSIKLIENFTGRALINQEFDIWYDRVEFFGMLGNSFAYLSSLNVYEIDSITLFAADGTETIVDDTTYRLADNKAKFDQTRPSGNTRSLDAVRISVKAGYGADDTEMPEAIKDAIYSMVSTRFHYNGQLADGELKRIPDTIKTDLAPYRSTINWFR